MESPLGESMSNMSWEIDKQWFHLINSHHPGLDKKEFCVCMAFCAAIWDWNYRTYPDLVIEYSIKEGNVEYMKEGGKPLFTNEKEVSEVIERLKRKGIMWTTISYTVSGFRGKCRSRICPKVFYHLVSLLNMKPQIESDAWLIVSCCFEAAVQSAALEGKMWWGRS
jgi:hypothetical protein